MTIAVAYCWASGEIEIAEEDSDGWAEVPEGTIEFARGEADVLRELITVRARSGHLPGVMLVPGLPEFEGDDPPGDMSRVSIFIGWVQWAFSDWPTDQGNRRIQPSLAASHALSAPGGAA